MELPKFEKEPTKGTEEEGFEQERTKLLEELNSIIRKRRKAVINRWQGSTTESEEYQKFANLTWGLKRKLQKLERLEKRRGKTDVDLMTELEEFYEELKFSKAQGSNRPEYPV